MTFHVGIDQLRRQTKMSRRIVTHHRLYIKSWRLISFHPLKRCGAETVGKGPTFAVRSHIDIAQLLHRCLSHPTQDTSKRQDLALSLTIDRRRQTDVEISLFSHYHPSSPYCALLKIQPTCISVCPYANKELHLQLFCFFFHLPFRSLG